MSAPIIVVEGLAKTFSLGLIRLPARAPGTPPGFAERMFAKLPGGEKLHRQVEAVKGLSFEVREGEIFGFLGPNGAGKTTTIKMLLGLIFPTKGSATIYGHPVTDTAARKRLGFLPENPYLYQYLTGLELMDLCARLVGIPGGERRKKSMELIERVGLGNAADRAVRKYSKGMMQRLGLAQALLGDPDLLILDEPMTGLDPIGRKEVRDLLMEERRRGKTLFFSSHILSDVEMLCDRVAIVNRGQMSSYGRLDELLKPDVRLVEIELAGVTDALRAELVARGCKVAPMGANVMFSTEGEASVDAVLDAARSAGARVASVTPRRETLEDLFVRNALVSG
ncbi:MAG: ABC transporter ATP-binding protein [Deltaproteobacteria bacterium]